jgi:hypothetical protein
LDLAPDVLWGAGMENENVLGPPYTWCDDQCFSCWQFRSCPKRKRRSQLEFLSHSLSHLETTVRFADIWRAIDELDPASAMDAIWQKATNCYGQAADELSGAAMRLWDAAVEKDGEAAEIDRLCQACDRLAEATRARAKILEEAEAGRQDLPWGALFLLRELDWHCELAEISALATDVDFDEVANARGSLSSLIGSVVPPDAACQAFLEVLEAGAAPSPVEKPKRRRARRKKAKNQGFAPGSPSRMTKSRPRAGSQT